MLYPILHKEFKQGRRPSEMGIPLLPLIDMEERHSGLTKAIADYICEAAQVCFDRSHSPPQDFDIFAEQSEKKAKVVWKQPDEKCLRAWANKDDATRDGAYACALAASELCLGLYAVSRAETLTGADYYIAESTAPIKDLENCFRLEVSGTDSDKYEVKRRLNSKIRQAKEGKSNLPAYAAVVGFRVKLISIQKVD
jgi:hypothetical protein